MNRLLALTTAAVTMAALYFSGAAANGLGENRPFQFRSPNDRAARIQQLNLQELQESGFFDASGAAAAGAAGAAAGAAGDTNNGPTINCFVTTTTTGNTAGNAVSPASGSLAAVDDPVFTSTSTGNLGTNDSGAGGTVASDQNSTAGQSANVDGNSFSQGDVGSFTSGEATGDIDNLQDIIDGTLTASVDASNACGDFSLN